MADGRASRARVDTGTRWGEGDRGTCVSRMANGFPLDRDRWRGHDDVAMGQIGIITLSG
ncbi:hypothetical protein B0I35DRAFT_425152 [Stachybotrys elegans]|uniref:Uncharacterized protein n=1 Tax=Stachybotrys elegans TaxID=80388 RepID=A0A8K0SY15_9HYPO|nr:hypothetical protein B0I35DRAFT_425152 [Stachybotrys elegans]